MGILPGLRPADAAKFIEDLDARRHADQEAKRQRVERAREEEINRRLYVNALRPSAPPEAPSGAHVERVMIEAMKRRDDPLWSRMAWFAGQVRPHGPMDLKRYHADTPEQGIEYERAGNYYYGRLGEILKIPERPLMDAPGMFQHDGWRRGFKDDPRDQIQILAGRQAERRRGNWWD